MNSLTGRKSGDGDVHGEDKQAMLSLKWDLCLCPAHPALEEASGSCEVCPVLWSQGSNTPGVCLTKAAGVL